MSNFLKITKNGNFYLDGNLITTHDIADINEYFMQLLGFYISIDNGVTIDEIIHSVFGMKKFINGYFAEDYEVTRAFATTSKLDKKYKAIKIYKTFKVETDEFLSDDEYLYVLPEISFVELNEGEIGYDKLGDLPVVMDENITLSYNQIALNLKSKFSLLDILICIFEEMNNNIKNGEFKTI